MISIIDFLHTARTFVHFLTSGSVSRITAGFSLVYRGEFHKCENDVRNKTFVAK